MNKSRVLLELSKRYPSKDTVSIPNDNPTEILCETDPTANHPRYSIAVAVIDKSVPHYHNKTTESYTILKGYLDLYVDGVKHPLAEGEKFVVKPGQVHYAVGNETWIKCHSEPGWIQEDHILVDSNT